MTADWALWTSASALCFSCCSAINPNGHVPAMDDNGVLLYESHTMMRYITQKYKMEDHWYPADPVQRALVDQVSSAYAAQA